MLEFVSNCPEKKLVKIAKEILNENVINEANDDKIYPKSKELASIGAQVLVQYPFVSKAAKEIDRALLKGEKGLKLTKTVGKSTGKALLLSTPLIFLMKRVLAAFDDCKKQCGWGHVNLPARQLCIVNCKIKKCQSEINVLSKVKGNETKIKKLKVKLMLLKNQKVQYEKWLKDRPSHQKMWDDEYKKRS